MKSFKSIREGYSVEPGVSAIDDAPEDPLSFVEIKPKKSKVVKEDLQEAVSVRKEKHSWGTMMTVHHGSDTSYPLHPEHQSAIKKLRPGMKTTFKDETNSTVHAHREGDTVHLTRPKTGSTLTSLPYHHFDTSEHAKPVAKKPAGEYDRKVTDHLKKKYNEEAIIEAHTEDDIANGGTVIYKHDGKHYMAKVSHKTGGGAGTMIHTTSSLGHKIKLNQVVSTDASDWTKYKNIKEETEQIEEGDRQALAKKLTNKMYRIGKGLGNLAKSQNNTNIVTNLKNTKSDMHKAVGMANDSTVKKMLNKEETEQISEAPKSIIKLVQKLQTTKRHMVAKSRAKKLVTASKSASAAGDKMTADAAMSKSKRYSNIAKGMEEQMDEKVTSRDIKMAVGVAKDKRYAGGNMSGAVKAMEKMKPGLSKHPRVQQVLKSTQESFDKLSPQQKAHQYNLDSAQREIDRRHGEGEDMTGAKINKKTYEINKPKKQRVTEGVDFLKIWKGIKPVFEAVKTTHEDPLVVTKDAEGHIHTHANLSVANAIHGTDVKHQAIHTGKPVQGGMFTFQLSKHHAGALKEDAPFDAVAHKKELDQLMGKHMAAHTQTTKLINAKASQEQINKAQERNNAVKQEIRNHKDKVPKGPAPKPGSAADYYSSKKPGEYTGD